MRLREGALCAEALLGSVAGIRAYRAMREVGGARQKDPDRSYRNKGLGRPPRLV